MIDPRVRQAASAVFVFAFVSLLTSCSAESGVDYEVESDTNRTAKHAAKRSVVIRLLNPIGEGELRLVAEELKRIEVRDFDRTFIEYYLPGMKVGSGAWATTHFNPELEIEIYDLLAAIVSGESRCLPYRKYRAADYKYDWFDRAGTLIGESTGDVLEKIIWRNPADGRLVAIDPEPGEPFADQSAATGHYFAARDCDASSENHSTYFYQGEELSEAAVDDPVCIQSPFVVDGEVYYGYLKAGEAEFRYRSSRPPISINPERKCQNWRSKSGISLVEGELMAADIKLPEGPYERRPKAVLGAVR